MIGAVIAPASVAKVAPTTTALRVSKPGAARFAAAARGPAARGLAVRVRAAEGETELPPGACPGCGNPEGRKGGCNGAGRIPGGATAMAAMANGGDVPEWWPIKVYRPCPLFLEAGNAYKSAGQSVDDIFFGGGSQTKDFLGQIGDNLGGNKDKK